MGKQLNKIFFEVLGYPPAKSEALSMLGAGHPHAARVRLLLEAAQLALAAQTFTPVENSRVALHLVVHTPPDRRMSDATNFLGGVADVLEDKSRRRMLEHLGVLATVWLYRDDRQIKEITYREVEADDPRYEVAIQTFRQE